MRRAVAGCLVLSSWVLACDRAPLPTTAAIPTPTPFVLNYDCRGELSELGEKPFPTGPLICRIGESYEERHCPGAYVAVVRNLGLLGGNADYYDGNRRRFASTAWADYTAYCNGTAFAKTWGTLPGRCPTNEIVTNLCR